MNISALVWLAPGMLITYHCVSMCCERAGQCKHHLCGTNHSPHCFAVSSISDQHWHILRLIMAAQAQCDAMGQIQQREACATDLLSAHCEWTCALWWWWLKKVRTASHPPHITSQTRCVRPGASYHKWRARSLDLVCESPTLKTAARCQVAHLHSRVDARKFVSHCLQLAPVTARHGPADSALHMTHACQHASDVSCMHAWLAWLLDAMSCPATSPQPTAAHKGDCYMRVAAVCSCVKFVTAWHMHVHARMMNQLVGQLGDTYLIIPRNVLAYQLSRKSGCTPYYDLILPVRKCCHVCACNARCMMFSSKFGIK